MPSHTITRGRKPANSVKWSSGHLNESCVCEGEKTGLKQRPGLSALA
jgi:hypothetical protein